LGRGRRRWSFVAYRDELPGIKPPMISVQLRLATPSP
jgi:hypothetical protein